VKTVNPLNIPRLLLAAIVAAAFLTLCGGLLVPIIFPAGSAPATGFERAEPVFPVHVMAWFLTSALLAWIFPIGYRGGVAWAEGLRFGMLLGLLNGLPDALHTWADIDTVAAGLVTRVLWNVITWGIAGALIGTVYSPVLQDMKD
jgi:hypothetical protein